MKFSVTAMIGVSAMINYLGFPAVVAQEGEFGCPPGLPCGTPDGLPPALEHVCDQYKGRDFGLCNAYCEAQDCESPDADKKSCDGLRAKFLSYTGETRFPCEPSRCPCWDSLESLYGESVLDTYVNYHFARIYYVLGIYSAEVDMSASVWDGNCAIGTAEEISLVLPITAEEEAGCKESIHSYVARNGVGSGSVDPCAPLPVTDLSLTCP